MRAVRSTDTGVTVVDVPAQGAGVRVRVRSAGICGSDLEMVRTGFVLGATLGHEIAGVTDDDVAVAVLPIVPCGTCPSCLEGNEQRCRAAGGTMHGVVRDGGMADEVWVDPSCLSPLPAGVRVDDASLVEPIAVALHACNRAGVVPGMPVGVVGAGTIGLLCGAVARHLGAEVTITARHESQRRAAEALGLTVGPAREQEIAIEAAGTASGFDDAVRSARRGGTVVLVSTTWEPIAVSFLVAQMRETTIVPAFMYGHDHDAREFDTAVTVLAARPEIASTLITHRFGLDEAPHAFAVAADRAAGAIKVVLHP